MRLDTRRTWQLFALAGSLAVAGVVLVVLPFVVQPSSVANSPGVISPSLSTTVATGVADPVSSPATAATAPASQLDTMPQPAFVTTTPPRSVTTSGPLVDAYHGLGTWVDLYDTRAWRDPSAAVADMAKHGVKTLYLETSNSGWPSALNQPSRVSEFVRQAHAHRMRVVAWYLPTMTNRSKDAGRISQAIGFRTSDGQTFDSFALDIESSAVRSLKTRNATLAWLSAGIRRLVGRGYPLGAIIPSPTALAKKAGYWNAFPYSMLARDYDVFLPMSYYTYHGNGARAASADTASNVRILRAQKGCSATPIHLIGGLVDASSTSEVHAFVSEASKTNCIGASLYDWMGTTNAQWRELASVPR